MYAVMGQQFTLWVPAQSLGSDFSLLPLRGREPSSRGIAGCLEELEKTELLTPSKEHRDPGSTSIRVGRGENRRFCITLKTFRERSIRDSMWGGPSGRFHPEIFSNAGLIHPAALRLPAPPMGWEHCLFRG